MLTNEGWAIGRGKVFLKAAAQQQARHVDTITAGPTITTAWGFARLRCRAPHLR